MSPVLQLDDAGLRIGERTVWQHLDLQVEPGEFLTVLGPNGSGKSSLLKVLLGLLPLSSGRALLEGRPVRRGARSVGYVPQLRGFSADVPLRGRDLVRLGVDGHRCGLPSRRGREQVRRVLAEVEGERLGGVPLGRMSGGEQQRMRLAQALATSPRLLLCDEPLLSLDPRHQERVVELVDRRRRTHGTAVVFVTHEIEPVAAVSDRVLRLREGVASLGSPEEVLRSDVLSAFYGADVVLALGERPDWSQLLHEVVNFDDYRELLPLVVNSLLAGAALGLVGGLMGVFVITRDLPFAVHGISELSFAGASGALLLGGSVVAGSFLGSIAAAVLIGVLGTRARDRHSVIGTLMPFGLGLGILFLSLYHGRAANKFGLLTGQVVAVDDTSLVTLLVTAGVVVTLLAVIWRPLMFASVDPDVAVARGVPVGVLHLVFMLMLGGTVAVAVQVVGALLVLALLCTPAAAALRVTTSPVLAPVLSVVFATTAMVGGILLAVGSSVPISPYVTTVSFLIYLVCRVVGWLRERPARSQCSARAGGALLGANRPVV